MTSAVVGVLAGSMARD